MTSLRGIERFVRTRSSPVPERDSGFGPPLRESGIRVSVDPLGLHEADGVGRPAFHVAVAASRPRVRGRPTPRTSATATSPGLRREYPSR